MDPEPGILLTTLIISGVVNSAGTIVFVLLLLACSALISASEVALFSLTPAQKAQLAESTDAASRNTLGLLEEPDRESAPKRLLATILIANNAVNIAFVLTTTELLSAALPEGTVEPWVRVFLEVAVITFIIVLFGEVIPKVFATGNTIAVARFMSTPLRIIQRILHPLSWVLLRLSSFLESRLGNRHAGNISVDELGHALELTADDNRSAEEHKILEGIVTFGAKEVAQIMTPRLDIAALREDAAFSEVLADVLEKGYSRWPVYGDTLDQVRGFLFVKDLLPHIDEQDFRWQSLIRTGFFVPENKKIDDLLQEFQRQKIHLAIVVDEYGGTLGLVTLEDILEEIVGDISDEFDEEEARYSRLDQHTYVFEGKIGLVDVARILELDEDLFEKARGDSSTLAGFLIEQSGRIPDKGDQIHYKGFTFTVEAADKRRIKRIKIALPQSAA